MRNASAQRMSRAAAVLLALVAVGAPANAARSTGARYATYETGFTGGEPTLGILRDGSLLAQAFTHVVKSRNGGRRWTSIHEQPEDLTLDPYIHVDAVTNRIISSQLYGACQLLSISDDGGESWLDAPTQCGTVDHQKIRSGPWHDPTAKPYPRSVYSCMNHVGDTACAVSLDGGMTWLPPITVFPGVDPTSTQGVGGVPALCGGLEGDPVSGPDGTIYVPREYCGRPFVGVSTDDGLTWTRRYVAAPAQTRPIGYGANNPSVTVAADGAVFYAWTGADWRHYVARSTDKGATWSKPWRVSPGDVHSSTFPEIVAGRAGAVATAYIGTRQWRGSVDEAPKSARWHLYVSYTLNGNAANPKWSTTRVTLDPLQVGCVARHGPANCANDSLLDFNDIGLDAKGHVVVSYADACPKGCKVVKSSADAIVSVAIETAGPSLR